jgi:hypothetical protein
MVSAKFVVGSLVLGAVAENSGRIAAFWLWPGKGGQRE